MVTTNDRSFQMMNNINTQLDLVLFSILVLKIIDEKDSGSSISKYLCKVYTAVIIKVITAICTRKYEKIIISHYTALRVR